MADTFSLIGTWASTPLLGNLASGVASIQAAISETLQVSARDIDERTLTVDTPVAVDFGGVTDANVLIVSSNRKVTVRLTSADGAQQSIPCDGLLVVVSRSVPFTAADLTRVAATETKVRVFLGERA